jgi:choline dehydrogenase-like flavoprotein
MTVSDPGPIVYVDRSRVREGRLDELREAMAELVAFVAANEPDIRSYDVYFDAEGERIEAAIYNTPEKRALRQEADSFVLAAGAIEIPRLLLLSRSETYPDGLGNSSGLVGRYFMEHPTTALQGFIERPPNQEPIYWRTRESHQFYDHEQPTPGSFKLHLDQHNPYSPLHALTGYENSFEAKLMDPVVGDAWQGKEAESYAERSREVWGVSINSLVEMLPRKTNQVTLDTAKTDNYGNPVPDVSFEPGNHAMRTLERASEVQRNILEAMGATDIGAVNPPDSPGFASHHMGTTRMGRDPAESVVNARLRTHDVSNLTIASSSVFRTAGAMNPTLTIAALALKAADHVDADL